MDYRIYPPEEYLEAVVNLPLSKSVANRALIMKALTPGNPQEFALPDCDDSKAIIYALNREPLGEINIGAAGTAMRFLTAYFSVIKESDVVLDGSERMRNRPIGPLVDALRSLGADISYVLSDGYPPLKIRGKELSGGTLSIDASVSSQYISALMMIAPLMKNGLHLQLVGEVVSRPYILMTAKMMTDRGIEVEVDNDSVTVRPGFYEVPEGDAAEKDWSAASYWAEIVTLAAGEVKVPGLFDDSMQGDRRLVELFEPLGLLVEEEDDELTFTVHPEVHSRINFDMSENPDLAQTVAVTAALLRVPFTLTGLSTLRIKETDRLDALRRELDKLGYIVEITRDDSLTWEGAVHPLFEEPVIDTYDDHRMAMAFAPAAIYYPGLVVKNVEVVSKSYPGFWDDLRSAGFVLEETGKQQD